MQIMQTARAARFGSESYYYGLYQEDPSKARTALINTFKNVGAKIKETARIMRCSRNTVRSVLKRYLAGDRRLENRSTRPCGAVQRRAKPAREDGRLVVVPLSLVADRFEARQRESIGAVLIRVK